MRAQVEEAVRQLGSCEGGVAAGYAVEATAGAEPAATAVAATRPEANWKRAHKQLLEDLKDTGLAVLPTRNPFHHYGFGRGGSRNSSDSAGIHGRVPQDILHLIMLGCYKAAIGWTREVIIKKGSGTQKENTARLEMCHNTLRKFPAFRLADGRELASYASQEDPTASASMTGKEYGQLLMLLPYAIGGRAAGASAVITDATRLRKVQRALRALLEAHQAGWEPEAGTLWESDLCRLEELWETAVAAMTAAFSDVDGFSLERPKIHHLSHLR